VDAYNRLLKLNLKDKQEREIVRVILHCVGGEEIYNPYYAFIATKFCQSSHGFKITLQYALWDALRSFDEVTDDDDEAALIRRISHLSKFYSGLVGDSHLSLTILKVNLIVLSCLYPQNLKFENVFNRR
jgi:nucleolar MIF4G domain-containing protein 1